MVRDQRSPAQLKCRRAAPIASPDIDREVRQSVDGSCLLPVWHLPASPRVINREIDWRLRLRHPVLVPHPGATSAPSR